MYDVGQLEDPIHRTVLMTVLRDDGAATVLSIARATHLSTVVLIPTLHALADRDLLARRVIEAESVSRQTWGYQVTAAGRRALQSRG